MSSPESRGAAAAASPRVAAAREFFSQLRKGARTIAMYRHNAARFSDIIQPAFEALTAALEPGPLVVRVQAEAFLLEGQEVWSAEGGGENVPFRFYREGVRQLVLRPGMSLEELNKLVLILLTNTERTGEEIVAQLWGASFDHVDYVVVDGFRVGEMSEEQVHVEVDQIVDYLAARLRGDSDDTVSFAKISAADLDLKLEGISQIRGALFDGDAVSPAYKRRIQEELERDEREKLPARLLGLFELQLREGAFEAPVALELLTNLVDAALLHEDLAPVTRMLDALDRVAEVEGPVQQVAREIRAGLGERLGDESRLRRLADVIRQKPGLDLAAASRYVAVVAVETVPILLDVLEALEPGPTRAPFVEALARLAPERPALLEDRLQNASSATVRDLVAVVLRGNFPDGARYLQASLRNPNPQVRISVLAELGASPRPELSHRFVLEATLDKQPTVRAAAFKTMVQLSPKRALVDLLRLPKLPTWDERDAAERELIHACLGQTQLPEALTYFQQLLAQKKSLLNSRKVTEGKLHAIAGLAGMSTLPAFKLLQSLVDAKEDEEVVAAARKAMYAVKKALFETTTKQTAAVQPAAAESEAEVVASADAMFEEFQAAKQEAEAEAAEERAQIEAAMRVRAAAESEELERREADRKDQMARPFGLDPAQLAQLADAPQARPPPPDPGAARPSTRETRVISAKPETDAPSPLAQPVPVPRVNGKVPVGRQETKPFVALDAVQQAASGRPPPPPPSEPAEELVELPALETEPEEFTFDIDLGGDS